MIRVGQGYDIHKLVEGRSLFIGGVHIPSPKGAEAHSDGDALLHALMDALLGALALGDIGSHFPPSDNQWKDVDSRELLGKVLKMVQIRGYKVGNVDCTVILEDPKLGTLKGDMARVIAADLQIPQERLSVKAKTKEGVGATGRGEAVEALVTLLLVKDQPQ